MKLILTFCLLLSFSIVHGQYTTVFDVKVVSKVDRQEIAFSTIQLYKNGKLLKTSMTNFDGVSTIKLNESLPVILTVKQQGFVRFDTILDPRKQINNVTLFLDTLNVIFDYRSIYNKQSAFKDLKAGKAQILHAGLIFYDDLKRINKCCKKYNFQYTVTTDVIDTREHLQEAMNNYNQVVMDYLNLRNKPGWKEELKKQCDINLN